MAKKNMNLRAKLLVQFLVCGITPLAIMGVLAYYLGSNALEKEALETLQSAEAVKKDSLKRYFNDTNNQIITFSENQMIIDAARELRTEFFKAKEGLEEGAIDKFKSELTTYYTGPYATRYREKIRQS